jgi:alanyl-tRNA synthetase
MKKLTGSEMRQMWFDFWSSKNHEVIESASLVPINDPTLLWINAGVTPLKKYFDGSVVPSNRRLASSQKCIRTNDIDNVGKTARHLTFFEMLGNFSIGDYFKKEAITWAWEFLTSPDWIGFEKEKLYITIYATDEEAYNAWIDLGVDPNHIIRLETNYWEIGPGPSGPDSEIFYDRGEKYDPDGLGIKLLSEEIDNDRYIEIWNNVFSQYNAKEGMNREDYPELPSKNIDTGMGLERMVSILQEVDTNFDTDLFMPIIKKIEEISGQTYTGNMPFKVIADHVRTLTFALSDGANFGNTGRDYVLRRLLRRAVRYSKMLGIEKPFMSFLVPVVVDIMKSHYPNLEPRQSVVMSKINKEEELFHKTLIAGEKRLNELFESSKDKKISGEEVFKLYDTYGFPFELTLEYASEMGYEVSKEEFDLSMKKQKELARSSRNNISSMNVQNEQLINFKDESKFVGYENLEVDTNIIKLFDGQSFVDSLTNEGYVVLKETPFYAESGGQVSDTGTIISKDIAIEVIDSFKAPNGQHFHYVKFDGTINTGDSVKASVNTEMRSSITKNHSAAHLLQKALREILDSGVQQAGSKVDEHTLRFDFTYENKISKNEVIKVEENVNNKVKQDILTKVDIMSLDEAKQKGAVALFDEKYGDNVRVVTIADSIELCGGTHVENVSNIGRFAIKSIESKGSNVYRIEATTGDNIEKELFETIKPYNDDMIKLLLKAKKIVEEAKEEGIVLEFNFDINNDAPHSYKDIVFNLEEMEKIKQSVQLLEKNYSNEKTNKVLSNLSLFEEKMEKIGEIDTIITVLEGYEIDVLKQVIDTLSNKYQNSFIFFANINNSNVNFFAKASSSLKDKIHCGNIVKEASLKSNGNGGGSPFFAQGGGTDVNNIDNIINEVKNIVKSIN